MATEQREYSDGYWWSKDGLRLHYREYAGREDRPPILCIPGLTRNARDFEAVAERLAGDWRVICVELRGRGESAYARDPMTYVPLTYLQDLEALLEELKLGRFVAFGTSLGGLLTMLLASAAQETLAGAMLNDFGPVIETSGLSRIKGYVGSGKTWPTWLHAARGLSQTNGGAYPNFAIEDWLAMAKRLCRLTPGGRIALDYDMKIAEPFRLPGGEAGIDLWPALDRLKGIPTLLVRGALSDILSQATATEMARRLPELEMLEVQGVGHTPTLTEPESIAAIDRLLARIDAGSRA